MKKTIIILLLSLKSLTLASTFIGNGGNAGDLELEVSRNVIVKTLSAISREKGSDTPLCTCPENLKGLPLCQGIANLNESQVQFCQKLIKDNATLIGLQLKNELQLVWTDQNLVVQELGQSISVDALANVNSRIITIQKDRFLERKSFERNFLLSHEAFHFIKYDSKPILDEQKIGPFQSATGGRDLLNAMASAIVAESNNLFIAQEHVDDLKRSRKSNDHWINLDMKSFQAKEDLGTLYIPEKYKGYGISYNYYLTDSFGIGAQYSKFEAKEKFFDTINASETLNIIGLNALYRVSISEQSLSFWGQSFLQFHAGFEFMRTNFKLQEPPLDTDDTSENTYLSLGGNWYFPLNSGLWITLGLDYNRPQYSYSKKFIDANFSKYRTITSIGVSYGF